MKLTRSYLDNHKNQLREQGIQIPLYDIDQIRENTLSSPEWIHFGGGNISRIFLGKIMQDLLNDNLAKTGIVLVEAFDKGLIQQLRNHDNLSLNVLIHKEANLEKEILGSLVETLTTEENFSQLLKMAEHPDLKMISLAVTEKGYQLKDKEGEYFPFILRDLEGGPEEASHVMTILTALAYRRFTKGALPIALVSMDNFSDNGEVLKGTLKTVAFEWYMRGKVDRDFLEYLEDSNSVGFPITMIDKITPHPSHTIKSQLEEEGWEDLRLGQTEKGSVTASFVNAEVPQYLVVENRFPNGKLPLNQAGVIYTSRKRVRLAETMKVTTCLNPLHTALAVTGCLLGYNSIAQEMTNPLLVKLIETIGYKEGLPVVDDPVILDPKAFIDTVFNDRLPNPFIPDTPQRIACDTSLKVGIRFGVTLKKLHKKNQLSELIGIPLALAAWCRYLVGVDDKGQPFELSFDPQMDYLQEIFSPITLGPEEVDISDFLSREQIFGLDLMEAGIGSRVLDLFNQMRQGPGAVAATLEQHLK